MALTFTGAIADGLKLYRDSNRPRIERALRDHLLSFQVIRNEIGDAIFSARIPPNEKPPIAVKLRLVARVRNNDIHSEDKIVHSIIQVDVVSRLSNAEKRVRDVSEMIRIATAAACFNGNMGVVNHQIWVYGCTVERESMETPITPIDESNGWQFQYSQDLRISHNQTITVRHAPICSPFEIEAFETDAFELC